ncbi:hypothetical protein HHK36_022257 [Tetracentron sinense]|uniref:Protein kinase domain-containing protein n=1 Tax=Tetracentron sinense TaxID=13715 RepID=A0A834YP85_TETSI|nr:hypothetical protein HHK36_022257 [Tetracentron sinense]
MEMPCCEAPQVTFGWRTMADGDAVSIFRSSHIWVDHNSLPNCANGLADESAGDSPIQVCGRALEYIMKEKKKKDIFLENGGLLLEEMITSFNGRSNPIRSFSKKELKRATNNYHQIWSNKWYKGTYEDGAILVKKFMEYPPSQGYIGRCIKDVVVASLMSNHSNVLKLLGCCLETEIPTLVCEFAANGSLYQNIYEEELGPSKKNQPISWESRLRIATEIADAVTYLHNGTSKPIIHRAIDPHNILLDEHYVAKLSDFGHSISIPLGQTHVDADLSTYYLGSVAPESKRIGGSNGIRRFTEKSDVYSFGVLLFEILTGKRVSDILKEACGLWVCGQVENSWQEPNSEVLLAEDNEEDIRAYLKAKILTGNTEQLMACAELAIRCVKLNPDERPSMMEAAKDLRRIRRFQHDSKANLDAFSLNDCNSMSFSFLLLTFEVENSCPLPNSEVLMVEDNEEDIRVYLKANILTGNTMQLMACAELAIRCVKVNPVERLSMMEAAKELRRIIRDLKLHRGNCPLDF